MRRFIKKEQSPQSQVEMAEVTKHFRKTWSKPLEDVIEAEQGSIFRMEPQITEKTKKTKKRKNLYLIRKILQK
jgi:hypothetical protein